MNTLTSRKGCKALSWIVTVAMIATMVPAALLMQTDTANAGTTINGPSVKTDKTTWDCVWFGSYPQTEIVDTDSKSGCCGKVWIVSGDYEVNATLYAKLSTASFDSNGDTTVDGVKYRRILKSDATFTKSSPSYYNWSDWTTYHYFRYDKIKWRVLEKNGDFAMLLADKALDDQQYNTTSTSITWENSTIRSWLNGYDDSANTCGIDYSSKNFIDSAFSSSEQLAIKNATLANDNNITIDTNGGNNTNDKVFLLSEKDVWNTETAASHGFVEDRDAEAKQRRVKSSSYAKAMGTSSHTSGDYTGICRWWLRSPGKDTGYATFITYYGSVYHYGVPINHNYIGCIPALYLNLKSHLWNYAGTVDSNGNYVENSGTAAKWHNISKVDAEPATCTTDGNIEYWYCSNCKAYYSDEACTTEIAKDSRVIKAGHDWDEGTVTTEPGCTTRGVKTFTCKRDVCNKTKTEEINANGHSQSKTYKAYTPAICTKDGNKAYWYCPDCKNYYSDSACKTKISKEDTVIHAIAHKNATPTAKKDATCTDDGNIGYWYCKDCTKYFADNNNKIGTEIKKDSWIIPKQDHTLVYKDKKNSTCTENGCEEHYYCTVCNKCFPDVAGTNEMSEASLVIKATGHNYQTIPAGKGCTYQSCGTCGSTKGNSYKAPSYVKGFKVSKGKKCFTAKWKKQSKKNLKLFSGYQIRYSTDPKMNGANWKNIGKSKKSIKIKGLAKKTRYYVELRTYTKGFYSNPIKKTVVTK